MLGIHSSHSKSALSPAPPRQQSFDLYLSDEGNDNDVDSEFSVGVNDDDYYSWESSQMITVKLASG